MRYFLVALALTVLLCPADAQTNQSPVNQRAFPDDNLGYPILITAGNSSGSGFYLNTVAASYLVTATHVLFNANTTQLWNTSFTLLSYSRDPSDRSANCITVDTTRLGAANIIRHPTADVTVVRLFTHDAEHHAAPLPGVIVQSHARDGILGVAPDAIKRFADVLVGNDVILFGYPTSLGLQTMTQIDLRRPLLRKGIVAGENLANRSIILDCPAYHGNSGGPVMEIDQETLGARRYRIIGVVDQYVPYTPDGSSPGVFVNSGYSVIVPMDFVLELVK